MFINTFRSSNNHLSTIAGFFSDNITILHTAIYSNKQTNYNNNSHASQIQNYFKTKSTKPKNKQHQTLISFVICIFQWLDQSNYDMYKTKKVSSLCLTFSSCVVHTYFHNIIQLLFLFCVSFICIVPTPYKN